MRIGQLPGSMHPLSSTEVVMLASQNVAVVEIAGSKRIATAVFAAALGIFFIYFAAFSHSTVLHNAAREPEEAPV